MQHQGHIAHRRDLVEQVKLATVVGDVGQAPKVDGLAWSKGSSRDGELTGEANPTICGGAACSDDEASGSGCRRA